MCAMPDDRTRLDALRKGITTANDNGYVAIRVADLRWLLDHIEIRVSDTQPPSLFELEGDLDDPEHD